MKELIGSTLLLATSVLTITIWIGCDSNDDPEVTLSGVGVVTGVVRETGTEVPVSDITVALNSVQTTTDHNGGFTFQEVPVGTRTLQVDTPGFDAYTKQIVVQAGENSLDVSLMRNFVLLFDHANTIVTDFEESAGFYKDVLGINELESPWANSSVRVFSVGENQQLHVLQQIGFEPATGAKHNHIALSIQDFDASLGLLTEEGIEWGPFNYGGGPSRGYGGWQTRSDGVRQIYFQDPVGNWYEMNDAQSSFQTIGSSYDHQGLYVSSLDESGMFYRDILRLKEITSPWNDTAVTRFFSMGNTGELHLVPQIGDTYYRKSKGQHMTFNVSSFDAYLAYLTSKGVEYGNFFGDVGEIDVRPDGVKQIYLQDPNGNWIEIIDAQY